jgi:glucokinase
MPKNPSSESLVFAVDLGGTHLRAALVDDAGRILKQLKQETPKGDSALCIVNALVNAAQQWESDKLPVVAAAIMVPGAVDCDKAVVLQAPNLPSLVNFELKAQLVRCGWEQHVAVAT